MRSLNRFWLLAAILGFGFTSGLSGQEWGDLDGTFLFKGTPPTPTKITPTKDPEYCGKHPLFEEQLVVNKENKGLQNVAVYLADTGKPKIHPDYEKEAKSDVALDNENCRFQPHMQGLRVGQTLVIGNKDPIGHNTKGDFFANTPFNDLIPAGGSLKKTFAKAEGQPSPVSCSIHPWMNAHLLIREDPYFAISDKDGKFTIKNLPTGEHTFVVWSNKFISNVVVNGKAPAPAWTRGRVKMNIKAGKNSLGSVEVAP